MGPERHRVLLEQAIGAVVGRAVHVEWVEPGRSWSARARLEGPTAASATC